VFVPLFAQVFSILGLVVALAIVPASWSFWGTAVMAALSYLLGSIPMLVAWGRFVPLVEKHA